MFSTSKKLIEIVNGQMDSSKAICPLSEFGINFAMGKGMHYLGIYNLFCGKSEHIIESINIP